MRTHFLVLAYERPEGLKSLLASIRAQRADAPAADITVLDNASRAETGTVLKRTCQEYGARYLRSEKNVFMRGKRVLEDHVFDEGPVPDVAVHLDDDVVLSEDWQEEVTAVLRAGRYAACGSVEPWEGELVYSGQRELRFTEQHMAGRPRQIWDWEWQRVGSISGTVPVEFAGHRAMAVLGEVATKLRHDDTYRIGGEDLDYSLELRKLGGHEIAIATGAVIQHRAHGEVDAPGFRTPENVISSWRHFYAKWSFLRANACGEAGMSLEDFVAAVTAPQPETEPRAASRSGATGPA
ncbi:glycosyltransferase family 2 protein [Streptomyces sp. PU-14G]|uniref:glycosyltransferase family 2 protein n=1 Tax=Streptomyces sp. PU-14G TaxID=2800808 RepID=UPI0034DE2502